MSAIDPARHPLLARVAVGARWLGQDNYPADPRWADEHEQWLEFLDAAGQLDRYLPRLKALAKERDEALAEIGAAYFLERKAGLRIVSWEPGGAGRSTGEFLVDVGAAQPMFVEVKSPGWEREVFEAEGPGSPRLRQPKYGHLEGGATAPWRAVRYAVQRAYRQIPATQPTILIINDDLPVPLTDWLFNVESGLYTPRSKGQTEGYLAEDGCFVDSRYERLGAVGVLNIDLRNPDLRKTGDLAGFTVDYRFAVYRNPNALGAVVVPPAAFAGYPIKDSQ